MTALYQLSKKLTRVRMETTAKAILTPAKLYKDKIIDGKAIANKI